MGEWHDPGPLRPLVASLSESQLITNDLLMAALDKAKVTNPFISCNLSILSYTLFTFVIYCFYVYGYWHLTPLTTIFSYIVV
jgi:hypothetical protein